MNREATLPIDTSVKMPAAVLAAAARSDEMFRAMQAAQGVPPAPEPGAEPPVPGAEPPAAPGAEPPAVTPPAESILKPFAPPAEPGAEPPVPELPPAEDSWEHKYKSLHGRFTRQGQDIQSLSDEVRNLQNVIASINSSAPPADKEVKLPELTLEPLITAEEKSDYGEDLLRVIGKRAREEFAQMMQPYASMLATLDGRVTGVHDSVAQSASEKMMAKLDADLPQWRQLNTEPRFLEWLALTDPFSGVIRHDMLKAASAQGNASRVLAFFKGFLEQEAALAPAAQLEPALGEEKLPKVPLASLAAPGRAKAAATAPATPEKPIITRAQISAFYAAVAAGHYRGRDAEKNQLEAMIFEAEREKRIR